MFTSFSDWVTGLTVAEQEIIEGIKKTMLDSRKTYSNKVQKYYREETSLFAPNRIPCKETVAEDLKVLHTLVGECLYAGDIELLFSLVIDPIFGKENQVADLSRLADPENLAFYENTISEWIEESETNLERLCFQAIKDKFNAAQGSKGTR
jgi:hypothetical protein